MFRFALVQMCFGDIGDFVGTVTGKPSWEYLLVDHNIFSTEGGVVTIDSQGQVVWACAGIGLGKDMLPNGNLATESRGVALQEVDASCQVVVQGSLAANGHEARIDGIDGQKILGISDSGCKEQAIACNGVLHFDRSTGKDAMVIDLGDHFDPSVDWGYLSKNRDWMHTNSVATGMDGNILVGIRHLSAIVSFDHSTYAKQWVLSSEIASNFSFDTEDSMFYNAHDITQLPSGNLLLFDNGNTRNAVIAVPFSRAAEYVLDFETMTASLVWQFRLAESGLMGSVRRLPNGNTLVHCAKCNKQDNSGIIYEVDVTGEVVSQVNLTAEYFTYRAEPVSNPPLVAQNISVSV